MGTSDSPIGDRLREKRVETLGISLREAARQLSITPAHLTDIEKGRRGPSSDLLLRIVDIYGIDEATLRSAWGKADAVVGEIAAQTPTTAAKAPALLRAARDLSGTEWDSLIEQAKKLAEKKKRTRRKSS